MNNHWLIAPILLPLLAGAACVLLGGSRLSWRRAVGLTATFACIPLALVLVAQADAGEVLVYRIGDWPPPFGIVLMVDRLSAAMVLLTAVIAAPCLMYASAGEDNQGLHFHALFQFQLMGLNGAFLTGDLFNLFVFFEVLLIASFALLLHGRGLQRSRAAVHMTALNLVGSALFLIAVGALYGVCGTLNLAHLARIAPTLTGAPAAVAQAGALLLFVVFALKAAVFPLGFWLPQAYSASAASVAALFSIMTKVGAYSLIRVSALVFDSDAGELSDLLAPWALPAALVTLAFGVVGLLATHTLRALVAWLVIVSMGMLLTSVGLWNRAGLSAAIYYLVHSTAVTAALFLIADLIARQRRTAGDRLDQRDPTRQPALLAALFLLGAVSIAGLPPLSGFLGKILILQAALTEASAALVWSAILGASLLVITVLTRAGSAVFWRTGAALTHGEPANVRSLAAAGALTAVSILLMIFGASAARYADGAADQLLRPADYESAVLGPSAAAEPWRRALQ